MMGLFPDCVPLAEDSTAELKRSHLNVCTVYGVFLGKIGWQFLSIPYLTEVKSGANGMVWLIV